MLKRRTTIAAALAALALVAAGCGESPEDEARSSGEDVGEALWTLQNAKDQAQASAALEEINAEISDFAKETREAVGDQVEVIRSDLRANLESSTDLQQAGAAVLQARSQADALDGQRDSVANEFWRGVREGYDDARD